MTWFLDKAFLEGLDLKAYDPEHIASVTKLELETVRAYLDPDRLHMVESNPDYGWLAGANEHGKPCLIFVGSPRFAAQNDKPLNFVGFNPALEMVFRAADIDLANSSWDDVLDVAEREVGFRHIGNCPMKAFIHPQMWHHALVPFPSHIHADLMEGGGDPDMARDWIESGNYVLHFGNAYYMNSEGEVESS
ncbi:MAG: hypothetical protein ACE366_09755 [Bradymonadia bacterium]